MYKIKFVDEKGKKREVVLPENKMWLTFGNFSGMGKFSKIKIKKLEE
jgi:hypothetical protein